MRDSSLELKLNCKDLERMKRLARRRGLTLTAYVRELVDADAQRELPDPSDERDDVTARLRSAGLLVEDWDSLEEEIAALTAQGVVPATAPVELPRGARSSPELIDEDRGAY